MPPAAQASQDELAARALAKMLAGLPKPPDTRRDRRAERAAEVSVTASQRNGVVEIKAPKPEPVPEVVSSSKSPAASRLAGGETRLGQTPVTQEHRKEAARIADLKGLSQEDQERALDTIARNIAMLPPGTLRGWKIKMADTGTKKGHAVSRTKTIEINPNELKDSWVESKQRDGYLTQTPSGVGAIEYTITHEIGHVVDHAADFEVQKRVAVQQGYTEDQWRDRRIGVNERGNRAYVDKPPAIAQYISRYAQTNNAEYRAEGWVQHALGWASVQQDRSVGEVMKEAVRQTQQKKRKR